MERPELEPAVLIASLLEHASRPLHVHVLGGRGGERPIEQRLAQRFPQVTFSWVPTRSLKRLDQTRLLLPDLLPDVDRVVLLPVPAVATADVAELADLDLGAARDRRPHRAAARARAASAIIHAAALRLAGRVDLAAELRRTAHARHAFDFDAFSTDVHGARPRAAPARGLPRAVAGAGAGVRAARAGGAAVPVRPGPRGRSGALGRGADPHAGARRRPPPLGRPRQAVASPAHARARPLARVRDPLPQAVSRSRCRRRSSRSARRAGSSAGPSPRCR